MNDFIDNLMISGDKYWPFRSHQPNPPFDHHNVHNMVQMGKAI